MKKVYSFSLLIICLIVALTLCHMTGIYAATPVVAPVNILDSILPNELPRRPSGEGAEAIDPADGMPSTGREHDRSRAPRKGVDDDGTGDTQMETGGKKSFSIGMAVLVTLLALLSVVLACVYVFREKGSRQHRE